MRRKRLLALTAAAAIAAFASISLPNAAFAEEDVQAKASGKDRPSNNVYVVRMAEQPVVAYDGDIRGYAATRPAKGSKINPLDGKVARYKDYLASRHDAALAGAGGGRKLQSYGYVFNGFAAEMTAEQAKTLAQTAGVLAVSKDELVEMDTSSTPDFLGVTAPGGLWDQLGGVGSAGEDIIIGIVDSGVWPEHPSFSDRTGTNPNGKPGKLSYQQIPGWHGKCTPGEQFNASNCNQKLIGAQYFNAAWGGNAGIEAQRPWEFTSPRDYNGHGTHTASTSGGNNGVQGTGPASVFGTISGIAPRARIASYKALWSTEDASTANGFTSDLVAAIDQAVADGVDVINFSISGTRTNFLDPVQVSFLFAADAGVFVAASAGNSGPTTTTAAHPGPWLTTVAAGTHNRNGQGSTTLGNGATYNGASVATAVSSAPLIDSATALNPAYVHTPVTGIPDAATAAALCVLGSLDPAKVTGKIVLCDRGVIARVEKSLATQIAGGVGTILVNVAPGSLNADFHFVPTVHLQNTDRAAVKAYAATSGATASIAQATIVSTEPAPFTASFSSRGPLSAGGGDLLKPDVIAPGQDILAGVAPPGNRGRLFDLYSGTSMSSPHVAGLAALLKNKYPSWSPMAIKSALMTSAGDVLDGPNTNPLVIFRQGAGHVRPNSAADPGLVFDANFNDWLAFLCGTTNGVNPASCSALSAAGYSLDPSDLNSASIAIGDMAGVQTVTRRVTNVGSSASTYTASYTGMAGFTVEISPATLNLAAGATGSFTVKFTRTTATLSSYTGGQLTWTDGTHNVRVPMVVRPVALGAPTQVGGSYRVTFGYTGTFSATPRGLIAPAITDGTVTQDPDQTFVQSDPTGTVAIPVTIPAGTTYARFSLFDADVTTASDLDLYIYQGTTLVGVSAAGGSNEEVNFTFATPTASPIALTAYVHGWGVTGGTSPFKLHFWGLGSTAAGNMTVTAPASATLGATGTIGIATSGLAPATKYLGSVVYGGTSELPNPTIVRVDTP